MRQLMLGVAVAALAIVAIAVPSIARDNDRRFEARLNGYLETPSVSTTGSGSFSAWLQGDTLHFKLSYRNLTGPAAVAHIHFARPDVSGAVSAFLCGGGGQAACPTTPSAEITGTIVAANVVGPAAQGIAPGEFDELIRAIRNGATYANVHTALFPTGEIRGNIRSD